MSIFERAKIVTERTNLRASDCGAREAGDWRRGRSAAPASRRVAASRSSPAAWSSFAIGLFIFFGSTPMDDVALALRESGLPSLGADDLREAVELRSMDRTVKSFVGTLGQDAEPFHIGATLSWRWGFASHRPDRNDGGGSAHRVARSREWISRQDRASMASRRRLSACLAASRRLDPDAATRGLGDLGARGDRSPRGDCLTSTTFTQERQLHLPIDLVG